MEIGDDIWGDLSPLSGSEFHLDSPEFHLDSPAVANDVPILGGDAEETIDPKLRFEADYMQKSRMFVQMGHMSFKLACLDKLMGFGSIEAKVAELKRDELELQREINLHQSLIGQRKIRKDHLRRAIEEKTTGRRAELQA